MEVREINVYLPLYEPSREPGSILTSSERLEFLVIGIENILLARAQGVIWAVEFLGVIMSVP
jgi:hypothetical protein